MKRTMIGILAATVMLAASLVATGSASAVGTASISGTVRIAGTGAPLAGMRVGLYEDREVTIFGSTFIATFGTGLATTTAADGSYAFTAVDANADGYYVCFAGDIFGPLSRYEAQCYHNQGPFNPFPNPFGMVGVPPSSTKLPLSEGQQRVGIDADMVDVMPGSVSGRVTATGGANLGNVRVSLNNPDTPAGQITTTTAADGTYSLHVPPGTYGVCFDARSSTGGSSPTGYAGVCYSNKPWVGGVVPLPSGYTTITVGSTEIPGINAVIAPAGAIAGNVTQRLLGPDIPGPALVGVKVLVMTAGRSFITSTKTVAKGAYRINGLLAGATFYVCFDPEGAKGGFTLKTYKAQCYKHVAYVGRDEAPPANATGVIPAAGVVKTVNETLQAKST